jgi:SAM-dependent methyltransferase
LFVGSSQLAAHPFFCLSKLFVTTYRRSLVRKLVSNEESPDCLHKCTIAVKLADDKHIPQLDPKNRQNSKVFARFMKRLRNEEAVAILGKDKHGRFGILAPMERSHDANSSLHTVAQEFAPEDFAAVCYVGDVKEVMEFLTHHVSSSAAAPFAADNNNRPPGTGTAEESSSSAGGLWKPPGADDEDNGTSNTFSAPWETNQNDVSAAIPWETSQTDASSSGALWSTEGGGYNNNNNNNNNKKRGYDEVDGNDDDGNENGEQTFHANEGAAAADAFYSGLTRTLDTRSASRLYHMRAFNGWVKAMQIQELDPRITKNGKVQGKGPLRVLDLACGKGGDLTKWTLHPRGLGTYVGSDVARGSLRDAAIRSREMRKRNKLKKAVFTCADLGADVPGRKKSSNHKHMQTLLTWSLEDESEYELSTPEFKLVRGGGIKETDRFDVVSIQFAIHYMMQTGRRARRFFHTVSELLETGGNLICTTIDARVVIDKMLALGLNYHFDDESDAAPDFTEAVVTAGAGVCRLRFEPEIVKRIFASKSDGSKAEEECFGLQYAFTLVEGQDHAAGVGNAVNLPEWLTPLPVLEALAREAGLELDYAQNFHEFYEARKDPNVHPAARQALNNMKVLNRDGSISEEEWSVSRLYAAIRFRKVRESTIKLEEEQEEEQEDDVEQDEKKPHVVELDPIKAKKMLPMAMMKAKKAAGAEQWNSLSSDEKKRLTQIELEKLAGK